MINSIMDIYKKDKIVTYALITALVLLVGCLSCMVYSYVKLQQAHPLENLRGAIIQPVYDGDPVLAKLVQEICKNFEIIFASCEHQSEKLFSQEPKRYGSSLP